MNPLLQTAVLHATGWDPAGNVTNVLTAAEVLLLYLKLQQFARVFQPLRSTPVDVLRGLLYEMRWFLALMALFLVGFANAFFVLFRLTPLEAYPEATTEDFSTMGRALVTVVSMMLAMFDIQTFFDSR
jgi:hypothetical protein